MFALLDSQGKVAPLQVAATAAAALVLVDIPIGLADQSEAERQCDVMARALLGPRRASVFQVPVRPVVHANVHFAVICTKPELVAGVRHVTPFTLQLSCLFTHPKGISNKEASVLIYRRRTYTIRPEMAETSTAFFEQYLLPNQMKHGATLVGRWVTENRDEIVAIWEYPSYEEYKRIEAAVRNDPLHPRAEAVRSELGEIRYAPPRHIVSAAGYITNACGEVLLVKTNWRNDTWELPGGQVEEGEDPLAAVQREIREETGIEAQINGLTGVYYNTGHGICNLVFRGVAVGGQLSTSEETVAVKFLRLDEANVAELIAHPYFRIRVMDAMRGRTVPYEGFRLPAGNDAPYELLSRKD